MVRQQLHFNIGSVLSVRHFPYVCLHEDTTGWL
jgi:hypothetical protein